jgi:hypothetical protein
MADLTVALWAVRTAQHSVVSSVVQTVAPMAGSTAKQKAASMADCSAAHSVDRKAVLKAVHLDAMRADC